MNEAIYKYFDENGLKVKSEIIITLFQDFEKLQNNEFVYTPIDYPFDISPENISNLFVEYVYDTTEVNIESLNNIDRYFSLNEMPFIIKAYNSDDNFHYISLAFGKINGGFKIDAIHNIFSLGNIQEINGDLVLSSTEINNLGKLIKVCGSFWISQTNGPYTNLKSLENLEYVGCDLNIKQSPIINLGKLKYVGGNLNLRRTNIKSIHGIEEVGGNLLINKHLKGSFDLSFAKIHGKVKYYND